MTDELKPSPEVVLEPCPFCAKNLRKMSEGQGYLHPKTNCTLSDYHMEADGYSEQRWNTRALRPATMPGCVVERTLCGEKVCGFKVAAYRETHPEHGAQFGHIYSEHWSTPATRNPAVKVERLFTEDQLLTAMQPAIQAAVDALETDNDRLVSLLTKAVGDIAALLVRAGDERKIADFTGIYVEAINAQDHLRTVTEQGDGA